MTGSDSSPLAGNFCSASPFKKVVFEEDEAEADVFVVRGVHVAAHLIRCGPKFRLEAKGRPAPLFPVIHLRHTNFHFSLANDDRPAKIS